MTTQARTNAEVARRARCSDAFIAVCVEIDEALAADRIARNEARETGRWSKAHDTSSRLRRALQRRNEMIKHA